MDNILICVCWMCKQASVLLFFPRVIKEIHSCRLQKTNLSISKYFTFANSSFSEFVSYSSYHVHIICLIPDLSRGGGDGGGWRYRQEGYRVSLKDCISSFISVLPRDTYKDTPGRFPGVFMATRNVYVIQLCLW